MHTMTQRQITRKGMNVNESEIDVIVLLSLDSRSRSKERKRNRKHQIERDNRERRDKGKGDLITKHSSSFLSRYFIIHHSILRMQIQSPTRQCDCVSGEKKSTNELTSLPTGHAIELSQQKAGSRP